MIEYNRKDCSVAAEYSVQIALRLSQQLEKLRYLNETREGGEAAKKCNQSRQVLLIVGRARLQHAQDIGN